MARNLSKQIKKVLGRKIQESLDQAIVTTPVTTNLTSIGQLAKAFGDSGISAEEATKSLNVLADVLGSSSRNVILTRPKGKNRETIRIEGKDIHGGHVSISSSGVKTFEVQVNFENKFLLDQFQVGDRVVLSGKIVKKRLNLQIVDRKIQAGDVALLYLEDRFRSHLEKQPETEEEGLDILHELSQ